MGFKESIKTDILKNGGKRSHSMLAKGIGILAPTKYRGKAMNVLNRVQGYIQPVSDAVSGTSEAITAAKAVSMGDVSAIPAGIQGAIQGGKGIAKTVKMASKDIKQIKGAIAKRKRRKAKGGGSGGPSSSNSLQAGSEKRSVVPAEQLARMTAGIRSTS